MSTIYCTYLTIYLGNKLPPFYIGISSIPKIEKGYNGSVSSKQYKDIWDLERKQNPHLFKTKIIKTFENRGEAYNHETYLQNFFNVHKNPMYINLAIGYNSFNLSQSIQNKTHHFFNSEFQTNINNNRINKGTHNFINSSFQSEMSKRQKTNPNFHDNQSAVATKTNTKRIKNGTHNFLGNGEEVKRIIKEKKNRSSVILLRELSVKLNIKLGRNWFRKSDDWIENKIIEIQNLLH